jgi:hypothetical protein
MKINRKWLAPTVGLVLLPGASAWGADAVNSGDTSWIIGIHSPCHDDDAGGLRVPVEQEVEGLDSAVHGERAFEIG